MTISTPGTLFHDEVELAPGIYLTKKQPKPLPPPKVYGTLVDMQVEEARLLLSNKQLLYSNLQLSLFIEESKAEGPADPDLELAILENEGVLARQELELLDLRNEMDVRFGFKWQQNITDADEQIIDGVQDRQDVGTTEGDNEGGVYL